MDSILKGDWVLVTSEELEKPYDTMEGQIYQVVDASLNNSIIVNREGSDVELLPGEYVKVEVLMPRGR